MAKQKEKETDSTYLKLFKKFGFEVSKNGSVEAQGNCPWCDGDRFFLNVQNGLYKCHHGRCNKKGNNTTFGRWVYQEVLNLTTNDHRRSLSKIRGWPLQTISRFGFAWCESLGSWLLPTMNEAGDVFSLMQYRPPAAKRRGFKGVLPSFKVGLFGLEKLSTDIDRPVLVCEGAFDGITLDEQLTKNKTRKRFDIVAVPSAGIFKPEWAKNFTGRKVRLLLDADKAGREGQERITKILYEAKISCDVRSLRWPETHENGFDVTDLVRKGISVVDFSRKHCEKVRCGTKPLILCPGDKVVTLKPKWLWRNHIPLGSFVSCEGEMGTQKSQLLRDLTARVTRGLPFPLEEKASVEASNVIVFTSEDGKSRVVDGVVLHGGDVSKLQIFDLQESDGLDLLERLDDLEDLINKHEAKLVIIDALNSFATGNITKDSKARNTLSGPLNSLAKRTATCLLGVRNWSRERKGSSSQRSLGAVSLSHVSRCCFHTKEIQPIKVKAEDLKPGEERRFLLVFEKVSDAPKPKSIRYQVKNLSTAEDDSHYRLISWGKEVGKQEEVKELTKSIKKKVAKKGSKKR